MKPNQRLSERDVTAVIKLLHHHSDKWNLIGAELGFLQPELRQIQAAPILMLNAPLSYLQELLSLWTEWPTENHPHLPTLKALSTALRSSLVGLGRLADELEEKMIEYPDHELKGKNSLHLFPFPFLFSISRTNL